MFKLFLTFFHILDETTASCAVCYEACLHFGREEGDTTQRACSSPPGDRVSLLHYIHSLLAKGTCLWWSSSSFLLTRLNEQAPKLGHRNRLFPSFSSPLYSLLGLWWSFGPESICFSVDTTEWARQTWAWLFLSFYHSLSSLVGQNMLLGIPKENVAVHPLPTSHMTWSVRHELDVHFSQFHLNLDFRSLSPELWRGDFWRQTDVQHSFNPFVHFSDYFYLYPDKLKKKSLHDSQWHFSIFKFLICAFSVTSVRSRA